jgi:hypothetical protein
MWDWLKKRNMAAAPVTLTGAPEVRRMKTYSAQSGYVYQYVFQGQRDREWDGEKGTEYVFDVSADRKTWMPVGVFVAEASLRSWEQAEGRDLSRPQQFAIAKIALFQAFDEREKPEQMRELVRVRPADVAMIAEYLDL